VQNGNRGRQKERRKKINRKNEIKRCKMKTEEEMRKAQQVKHRRNTIKENTA
jgi:hypothetical protein